MFHFLLMIGKYQVEYEDIWKDLQSFGELNKWVTL